VKTTEKFEIFINPGGFIEQRFVGSQNPESVRTAIERLIKQSEKLSSKKGRVLILVDITNISNIDVSGKMSETRGEIVEAMRQAEYDRIAIYGDLAGQVMVNTLVLIAGRRRKIRVFEDRIGALKWLKSKA